MWDRTARRSGDPEGRLRILGQDLDAAQQHILQARRQLWIAVLFLSCGQQLLGKERIAPGAPVDPLDQVVGGTASHAALKQVCDFGSVEAIDVQSLHSAAAVELGEEGTERMTAVYVIGAVRHNEEWRRP